MSTRKKPSHLDELAEQLLPGAALIDLLGPLDMSLAAHADMTDAIRESLGWSPIAPATSAEERAEGERVVAELRKVVEMIERSAGGEGVER